MDDLISRQSAIDILEERLQANGYSNVALVSELNRSIGYLMRLPSVDAVEVVRCKDCVNCEYDSIFNQYWCGGSEVISDGFCNYGEREDPLHGAMNPPEDDITDGKGEAK